VVGSRWQIVRNSWYVASDRWQGCTAAKIITLVIILLWTISFAQPLPQVLTVSHSYGIDNCSLRFFRQGTQFDLGDSRSPTQTVHHYQLTALPPVWVHMYVFSLGILVMMVMVIHEQNVF